MIFMSDEVTEWKSLANHITSDQNIVIHGNKCIIWFLAQYFRDGILQFRHEGENQQH